MWWGEAGGEARGGGRTREWCVGGEVSRWRGGEVEQQELAREDVDS